MNWKRTIGLEDEQWDKLLCKRTSEMLVDVIDPNRRDLG